MNVSTEIIEAIESAYSEWSPRLGMDSFTVDIQVIPYFQCLGSNDELVDVKTDQLYGTREASMWIAEPNQAPHSISIDQAVMQGLIQIKLQYLLDRTAHDEDFRTVAAESLSQAFMTR